MFDEKVNLMESKDPQRILHLSLYYGHCDPGVVYLIGDSSERRKKITLKIMRAQLSNN